MPVHNIEPIYDHNSKILILGSFPSVKSRQGEFFYDHPQNRFWKVLAAVLGDESPETHSDKKEFLINHKIALWDVIAYCDISGSSDVSIKNVQANDIARIFRHAQITAVFCNGATAYNYYRLLVQPTLGVDAIKLPSTSPANAAFTLPRLCKAWLAVSEALKA